jgi:hypothetical protein
MCLFVCTFVCFLLVSFFAFVHLFVFTLICFQCFNFVNLSVFTCLLLHASICPYIYLSVFQFVHLSVSCLLAFSIVDHYPLLFLTNEQTIPFFFYYDKFTPWQNLHYVSVFWNKIYISLFSKTHLFNAIFAPV